MGLAVIEKILVDSKYKDRVTEVIPLRDGILSSGRPIIIENMLDQGKRAKVGEMMKIFSYG